MADEEHLRILDQGVDAWNRWRKEHSDIRADLSEVEIVNIDLHGADLRGANLYKADFRGANLYVPNLCEADLRGADLRGANLYVANLGEANLCGADLCGADLCGADLRGANLYEANLRGANLYGADLSGANLYGAHLIRACLHTADLREAYLREAYLHRADLMVAHLYRADLRGANLYEADLRGADLREADLREVKLRGANLYGADIHAANLYRADLRGADLRGADLECALLLKTMLNGADLTGCYVYGVSAWGTDLKGAKQTNLVITPANEPAITVDNLEVAQFIYLLLNNEKIRDVIDTITSKVVLILGRFAPERKTILDALRDTLRQQNYLPVLFDFDKPASRDLTETVRTLAHLARFVIADITDPKSIPQELQAIVPDLAVPIQPIIARPNHPWGMFEDFPRKYHWVLAAHEYDDLDDLQAALQIKVIAPAEAKAKELMAR